MLINKILVLNLANKERHVASLLYRNELFFYKYYFTIKIHYAVQNVQEMTIQFP